MKDIGAQAAGPIPDWAAVLVGLVAHVFLTMFLADELSTLFASAITDDEELATTLSLVIDLVFTYGGELCALWMTWHLCRSRSFTVVSVLAALALTIMLVDRWMLGDYGWPLWYEIALLCVPPLALASLYVRDVRRIAGS